MSLLLVGWVELAKKRKKVGALLTATDNLPCLLEGEKRHRSIDLKSGNRCVKKGFKAGRKREARFIRNHDWEKPNDLIGRSARTKGVN